MAAKALTLPIEKRARAQEKASRTQRLYASLLEARTQHIFP